MFEIKKTQNGPFGKILTKKEPIKTLGFNSRLHPHAKKDSIFPFICKKKKMPLKSLYQFTWRPWPAFFAEALIPHTLFQDCVTNAENVCLGGNLDQYFYCFLKQDYICKIPLTRRYTTCRPISHVPTYARAIIWSNRVGARSCTIEAVMVTAVAFIYIYNTQ